MRLPGKTAAKILLFVKPYLTQSLMETCEVYAFAEIRTDTGGNSY